MPGLLVSCTYLHHDNLRFTIHHFVNAPREALGGAAGTIREMIARVPFQRCIIGTEDLLQVLMLPAYVVAHLCNGLIAAVLLAVAKAEIDVTRIDGVCIRETAPGIYPQRW